jgi:flagellar hook-associated protein 2
VNLSGDGIQTIGDVVNAINRTSLKVRAEINDTGDGIRIRDVGGGAGRLEIAESGSTKTAAALHILGTSKDVQIDGETKQIIDGSTTFKVTLDADDSLSDLQKKINELGAGVSATTFVDGSSKPYRLSLTSQHSGGVGAMVIDTSGLGLAVEETVRARDALLVVGRLSDTGSNILVSSSSNKFTDVLAGVTLDIQDSSSSPVTISIASTDTNLVASVETMVTNYNKYREKLNEYTAYDADTDTKSVLTGDSTALRLDMEFSELLSGRFYGVGSVQSLGELGITFNDDGTLALDKQKFQAKYAADPEGVKTFFTKEETGFSARFKKLSEQLAGTDNSLLSHRFDVLNDRITDNTERLTFLNERLKAKEDRLYDQFYQMELAISKMQNNMSAIDAIKPLTIANNTNQK